MNLRLRTRDDMTFDLSGGYNSVGITRGENILELDIVEKTYGHGGVFIGERRLSTQEFTITVELNYATDTTYRAAYNEIAYYSAVCEYVEDTDNSLRTKVELVNISEILDNPIGSKERGGQIQIIFRQLTPFWEDLTAQTDTDTGTNLTFNINNSGVIDCPATFTITASTSCPLVLIYISSPVRGIEIQDLAFGDNATLDEMVIDNEAGTVELGDDSIDRTDRIRGGSGFFDFPVGAFTLNVDFTVSCQCDISWRRRWYI